jgi:hypothetical protein
MKTPSRAEAIANSLDVKPNKNWVLGSLARAAAEAGDLVRANKTMRAVVGVRAGLDAEILVSNGDSIRGSRTS